MKEQIPSNVDPSKRTKKVPCRSRKKRRDDEEYKLDSDGDAIAGCSTEMVSKSRSGPRDTDVFKSAFEIDLIIESFLSYVSTKDLLATRQVSKRLSVSSTFELEKRVHILAEAVSDNLVETVSAHYLISNLPEMNILNGSSNFDRFLETVRNSEMFPCCTLTIKTNLRINPRILTLLTLIGRYIKKLTLNLQPGGQEEEKQVAIRMIKEVLMTLPLLEKLNLQTPSDLFEQVESPSLVSANTFPASFLQMRGIMNRMARLKNLYLAFGNPIRPPTFLTLNKRRIFHQRVPLTFPFFHRPPAPLQDTKFVLPALKFLNVDMSPWKWLDILIPASPRLEKYTGTNIIYLNYIVKNWGGPKMLKKIWISPNPYSLKAFEDLADLISAREAELKLKSVGISMFSLYDSPEHWPSAGETVSKILKLASSSVTKVYWEPFIFLPGIQLPVMPNTKILLLIHRFTLKGYPNLSKRYFPEDFGIENMFPGLVIIKAYHCSENPDEIPSNSTLAIDPLIWKPTSCVKGRGEDKESWTVFRRKRQQ